MEKDNIGFIHSNINEIPQSLRVEILRLLASDPNLKKKLKETGEGVTIRFSYISADMMEKMVDIIQSYFDSCESEIRDSCESEVRAF